MELSKEQLAYLKSLDSKKKKRKFFIDCLIENIEIGESEKIKVKPIIFKDGVFETNDKEVIDFLSKCGFIKSKKPNYSPEEIELVKHNINQREVTEQGSELLKFDMLEKESINENKKLYAELISYVKNIPRYNFVSVEMAIDIENIVLKHNKIAK